MSESNLILEMAAHELAGSDIVPQMSPAAEKYSGKVFVRVSPALHESVASRASGEGVSMSQWVGEQLARSLSEPRAELESPQQGELLFVAKAIWEGNEPPDTIDISKEAASLLLDKLVEAIPGLTAFASAAFDLGRQRQAFDLANQLGFPRISMAELQNEITIKFSALEKSRPTLPYGFEGRSMGSVLGLFATLLNRSGRTLEELIGAQISYDHRSIES